MPWRERVRAPSPAAALTLLLACQLVSIALLARSGSWDFSAPDAVAGVAFASVELVLLYALGTLIAGPLFALWTGVVWIVAPIVLLRYWVLGGSPPTTFTADYHERFLQAAFGVDRVAAVAAGALLLASGVAALARLPRPLVAGAAAGAGAAAAAAALVHPIVWPALGAPVLALALARRPRAAAACAAVVLVGLGALALFRDVPGVHPGWHTIGGSLDLFREYSWSRRILEYLPLAGLVALAIRAPAAAGFFGWLLVTLIVFPLGVARPLLPLMLALVPALPVYALLAASIPLLVPQRLPARQTQPEPTR